MTMIRITDNKCWLCGEKKQNMTEHHALPQHLNPKHNVCIAICKDCHDKKINVNDVSGLYSYAYKLIKTSEQTKQSANKLKSLVEENIAYRKLNDLKNKKKINLCEGEKKL